MYLASVVALLSAAALALTNYAYAADLLVHPTRVVLTEKQKTAQVDIVNTGQKQASYKIILVRKRMNRNGEFQDVLQPELGEKFADEVVRYSPRQVTLAPGGGQTIRFMLKLPPGKEEGEYRSHLLLAKAPEAVTELPKEESEPGSISMTIVANVAVSIPVIARHGRLKATAAIDPASVKVVDVGKKQHVELTLQRAGNRSIYGDLAIFRGKEKVAESKGLAVYLPNPDRRLVVPVQGTSALSGGELVRILLPRETKKSRWPRQQ